jgi:pimeloyl-ACP methyl ester carboxylesterase
VVIRSAGHLPSMERPVETTDAILAFLEGLP